MKRMWSEDNRLFNTFYKNNLFQYSAVRYMDVREGIVKRYPNFAGANGNEGSENLERVDYGTK